MDKLFKTVCVIMIFILIFIGYVVLHRVIPDVTVKPIGIFLTVYITTGFLFLISGILAIWMKELD